MSEEKDIENINSSNDAEIEVNDNDFEENDNIPTLEDYQKLSEEKAMLEEKNKKLYARLTKLSANLRGQVTSSPIPDDVNDKLERLELKTEGFNDEEIEF